LDRTLLADHKLVDLGQAKFGERAVPLQLWRELAQLSAGHRVVYLLDVAAMLRSRVDLRDLLFERDEAVRARLGFADSSEALKLDQIVAIGPAVGVVFLTFEQIVVAVRHAEAA